MVSERGKPEGGVKAKSAVDAKAERLAAALRANLKRRKSQARDRAEQEQAGGDGIPKTR